MRYEDAAKLPQIKRGDPAVERAMRALTRVLMAPFWLMVGIMILTVLGCVAVMNYLFEAEAR